MSVHRIRELCQEFCPDEEKRVKDKEGNCEEEGTFFHQRCLNGTPHSLFLWSLNTITGSGKG